MIFEFNSSMKNKLTLLIVCVCSFGMVNAQTTKKTIVLYNVSPLEVDLAPDGTIINIYGKADDYFKGYTLVKNAEPIDLLASKSAEFYKPNDKFTVGTKVYNLEFRPDFALLTRTAIAGIDESVVQLLSNPEQKLLITPYTSGKSPDQKILLENRLKTVLMYLEIKGIAKSQIAINDIAQSTKADQLVMTLIKG